ncbi:tyrosine-type recombinase/integrase [Pyxidicoccus parkwayensis]|uniref:Tyrosine-type recombinase/integrase n=1 Tax=Pyxidicoccus parkwayensis TaxID=2813578 RepID=A0ABX7NLJ0_9BACT|nr:tyrosine-type recombinase/integrase [Pyxidicoccus parkwaysis]QSQ19281.1 tyrosine-type recombinase/integrase [Pyxidicoccus parkwaysis]
MAFTRRHGEKWYAIYKDEEGTQREVVTPARTKAQAELLANEMELRAWRVRQGLEVPPVEIKLRDAFEQFRPVIQGLASYDTIDGRWRNHILPALGDRPIHKIRPEDISVLLRSKLRNEEEDEEERDAPGKTDGGLGPQTVRHLRVHLQAFFTWAKKEARIFTGENPASLAWDPDVPEPEPRVLDLAEAETVASHASHEDIADMILTAAHTGLRRGELLALRWESVFLEDRYLVVRRSGKRRTTKTGRAREVPIPRALLPVLERRRASATSEWAFPDKHGRQRRPDYDINSRFRTALMRAGIVDGYEFTCVARKTRAPGERNGRSKLTALQVRDLRKRAAKGTTQAELARSFGVSPRTVGMIVRGERWGGAARGEGGCGHSARHPDAAPRTCPGCGVEMKAEPVPTLHLFKDLRASYLTHVVERTGDLKAAQDLGGHTTDRTTRRHYTAVRRQHLTAKVDEAFAGFEPVESSSSQFPVGSGENVPAAANNRERRNGEQANMPTSANGYEKASDSAGLRVGLLSRGSQVRALPGALAVLPAVTFGP